MEGILFFLFTQSLTEKKGENRAFFWKKKMDAQAKALQGAFIDLVRRILEFFRWFHGKIPIRVSRRTIKKEKPIRPPTPPILPDRMIPRSNPQQQRENTGNERSTLLSPSQVSSHPQEKIHPEAFAICQELIKTERDFLARKERDVEFLEQCKRHFEEQKWVERYNQAWMFLHATILLSKALIAKFPKPSSVQQMKEVIHALQSEEFALYYEQHALNLKRRQEDWSQLERELIQKKLLDRWKQTLSLQQEEVLFQTRWTFYSEAIQRLTKWELLVGRLQKILPSDGEGLFFLPLLFMQLARRKTKNSTIPPTIPTRRGVAGKRTGQVVDRTRGAPFFRSAPQDGSPCGIPKTPATNAES